MKKLLKVGVLGLALIATIFILNTKAATVNVNVQVTGTAGSCIFGTTTALGATWYSLTTVQTLTGIFTGTSALTPFSGSSAGSAWRCYDSNGVASWAATIISNTMVNQSNPSYFIGSGNVYYSNQPVYEQAGSGHCAWILWASTSSVDWKALSGSRNYLQKTSAVWEVCRVQTTGLYLKVNIPAGANIWIYSWTITITAPTF